MKAVLFDLDQTLLDREQSLLNFVQWQVRGMLRPYVTDEEAFIRRFLELDANGTVWKDSVYESLRREFGIEAFSTAELLSVYENCFCGFCVARAGARDAVMSLSRTYKLGLISNGMSPFQERNFRSLGFSACFHSVLVSQAVNLRKPDAAIFQRGCTDLGISPAEAVYVGDNPVSDIKGAEEAGLFTIFVPSALYPECSLADATCTDMKHLPSLIEALAVRIPRKQTRFQIRP